MNYLRALHPRKWMAMFIIAVFITGCDSSEPSVQREDAVSPNPLRITFWTSFSGGDISFMNELVNRYNKENPDGVTVMLKNNKSDDYYTKLSTAIVTEEGPDVAIVHASKFAQFVPAGFLDTIDDSADDAGVKWDQFNPNILGRTLVEGKHYAIPLDTHFGVLFYNKRILTEAGLLKEGEDLQLAPGEKAFMDFLQKIQQQVPPDVAPLAVPDVRIDTYWLWWTLYSQQKNGGSMYTQDGRRAQIDMSAARKALDLEVTLFNRKLIPSGITDASQLFAKGKAATIFLGVWITGSYEHVPGLDFGVIPFPQIYDKPGSWGDSHTLAFPKKEHTDPNKRAAAVKFANWVAHQGSVWAQAGHIPAVVSEVESDAFQSMEYRKDYASAANDVQYFPSHPRQGYVNDALTTEFEKLWHGKQTEEQLLSNMQPLINGIIGDMEP